LPNRFERFGNVGVIHDPTQLLITFPDDSDFDFETVSMQSTAFGDLGKYAANVRLQIEMFFVIPSFHFVIGPSY